MSQYFKTPGQQWPGVFVCALLIACLQTTLAYGVGSIECPPTGPLQRAIVSRVVDGDTLHLTDGRKLRLIAINTPELGRKTKPEQPLARQAKQHLVDFLANEKAVFIEEGRSNKDHHGRLLAHVFRADGRSVAQELLSVGLAWQVVVPPNNNYAECLATVEAQAREQQLGVWSGTHYPLLQAGQLTTGQSGFQRVQGKLLSAKHRGNTWWLQLDKLALRLSDKNLSSFDDLNPKTLIGKRLIVRGWVINRSASKAVKKHGYSPLMMKLEHPLMLN